jgi:hypothetical protein
MGYRSGASRCSTANRLRNKIACELDRAKIETEMDELRAGAARSYAQTKEAKKLDDVRIAAAAFERCSAYLVAATETARARKKP